MLWFPFAKINLGLAVISKFPDGYHAIESLLYPIKLYDILEIIESPDNDIKEDEITISGLSLDSPANENLVWKSLQLMRKHFGFPKVKIHLHKQIPSGAGLGGGSSDAAHTLSGINQLFKLNCGNVKLKEFAFEIGSDCPFFLNQNAQYAQGRGELLESYYLKLKPKKLLLIIPDFSISTQKAYGKIVAKTPKILPIKALESTIEKWKYSLINDFEKVIFEEFPMLADLKEKLYQNGAIYTSLSGSGSALYGLFSKEISIDLPKNYLSYWLNFPD